MSLPSIGILGLGYLGIILTRESALRPDSWGTWHKNPPCKTKLHVFPFEWGEKNYWNLLPEKEVILILTIPPVYKSIEDETERLRIWCEWIQKNRPKLKRLIYISTTGVYPKRNGLWREDSEFESDTNSGKIRLMTENILSEYFDLNVVRSGGIYGPGRGIDVRLKSGKIIPVSNTPVHRIHVHDLVQIIIYLVKNPKSASCLNAVDLEAKPSFEVAHWLVENRDGFSPDMLSVLDKLATDLTGFPKRLISNQSLNDLGIKLKYPTFREGMGLFDQKR